MALTLLEPVFTLHAHKGHRIGRMSYLLEPACSQVTCAVTAPAMARDKTCTSTYVWHLIKSVGHGILQVPRDKLQICGSSHISMQP